VRPNCWWRIPVLSLQATGSQAQCGAARRFVSPASFTWQNPPPGRLPRPTDKRSNRRRPLQAPFPRLTVTGEKLLRTRGAACRVAAGMARLSSTLNACHAGARLTRTVFMAHVKSITLVTKEMATCIAGGITVGELGPLDKRVNILHSDCIVIRHLYSYRAPSMD
jgi:hypothetical protein